MKVILIPGFLGFSQGTHFFDLEAKLTKLNITVETIDWTGSPLVLGEYSVTKTLEKFRRLLANENPNEIVLVGFSLGGVIAGVLASEFNIKKLGLVSSPYQFAKEDFMAGIVDQWQQNGHHTFTSSKYGEVTLPYSFVEDASQYNLLNLVTKVTCPSFHLAGTDDDTVPSFISKKIYTRANEPKNWILIQGMQHKYKYQPEFMGTVNEKIISAIISG